MSKISVMEDRLADAAREIRALEAKIKGLEEDSVEHETMRRTWVDTRQKMQTKIDLFYHEIVHYSQTVRSLHVALNMMTSLIRERQISGKELGEDRVQFQREVALAVNPADAFQQILERASTRAQGA